jgi:hypothetical protein
MSDTLTKLRDRRVAAVEEMTRIAETAHKYGRELSVNEDRRFNELNTEVDQLAERLADLEASEQRAKDTTDTFRELRSRPVEHRTDGAETRHPLEFTGPALDALQAAIDGREQTRVAAALTEEQRATLVTTTYGAPRAWGANVLDAPRLLHVAAQVPMQPVDAPLAQHPVLTLPTAQAAVAENASLGEYASSTAGSVTLSRYGRWTDLTRESLLGADAGAITAAHRVGVALDLDAVLVNAVETAAGSAVAFSADVPAAIRKALAQVAANTAAADVADLVILVNPDNIALLESVTPTGGKTMAEAFTAFSGALVYPTTAADTGFITVANLKAGARFFQARALLTETDTSIKTDVLTVATSIIGGYGLTMNGGVTGAYVKVDVVTP